MQQLIDEYTYSTTGVVYASPVDIMEIPFDSVDTDAPVNIEVSCFGTSLTSDNLTTTRFFFTLPILYFVTASVDLSTPTESVAVPYNSAAFSKMMHTDGIANFNTLQVIPYPDATTKKFRLELTVPDNSKSWDINVYVKVIKPKV